MTTLKQGRWVKIHEPGQANYDETENVMDITVGNNRCQAEVVFTVRSYRKAAYWLLKYLECAEAKQILTQAAAPIESAVLEANRESEEVTVDDEKWKCEIERMGQGVYRVRFVWTVEEPVARRGRKKKTVA